MAFQSRISEIHQVHQQKREKCLGKQEKYESDESASCIARLKNIQPVNLAVQLREHWE